LLDAHFPTLIHSAARLDEGSDVLGYDTPRSTDHHWGPRIQLFLSDTDYPLVKGEVDCLLRAKLPVQILGYPTNFSALEIDGGWMSQIESGPVNHAVMIQTLSSFSERYLNLAAYQIPSISEWLTTPSQCLRTVASGRIFHDGLRTIGPFRERLSYYPDDIWLYLLASQWRRICQEEPFVGRTGDVGDEIGSRIIAARLVVDIMNLCFLMERTHPPYIKWLGTAFKELKCARNLEPILGRILDADHWQRRESELTTAYSLVATLHNELGITEAQPTKVSSFHDRPYLVIHADRFCEAIRKTIVSDEIRDLPPYLGSIDQYVDSTDVLSSSENRTQFRTIYS
ncbi:MAG: DUF4037 domain-containing protein, partial [Candidatus Latescibacteria bacterium]|nr:DUF4037 domain-containing protein [Candidatus Latescibacterota bacterium]